MAVKCRVEVTLYKVIDIDKVTRYYILQSSTLAAPSKPADGAAISSKWSKTEPSYTSGSTSTLYFVDQTVMSNGALKYSEVSKSSSYEAAKEAWNKANAAQNTANNVNNNLNKLTGDSANYSQLNDNTASYWGFAKDSTADGHWYTANTPKRDQFISDFVDCYGAKKFRIQFDISTSVQANTTNSTTTVTKKYVGTAIGLYCYNDNNSSVGLVYSTRITGSANAPVVSVDSVVTTPTNTRKFKIFLQTEAWNNFSGTLKIRNLRVTALDTLADTYVEYYLSTSQTSLAGGSWSTTAPTWVNGKYMWSRTVKVDGAGNKTYSPSQNGVCIAGAKGDTGAKGDKGDTGGTGKGIKFTTITYQLSASRTTAPTGTWLGSPPATDIAKPYLWTRTTITYTDNTTSSPAYSVSSTLDSLVVGGRNLILDSDVWDTSGSTSTGITASRSDGVLKVVTTSGNGNWQSFSRSNVIEANLNTGDTFTFGIEIKSADGTKPPTIYFKNGMGYYSLKGTVSSDYSWCYYTGTWNKTNDISFHFGWSSAIGTYYIRKIKLEKGNILTDWSPAPEDIKTRIDDAYTEIESNKKEISFKASQTEVATISSNLNAYIDSTTTMIQNINGWQFNWSKLIRTDEADVANHTDYITLQNGDIILGESASELKLKIGNDAIQFKGTSDTEVTPDPDATAWITGQKLNINEGEIHTTLKVGKLQFTPRPNGNFSITIV
jgi:hypothetical protein